MSPIVMSGDSLIADQGGGPQGSCYLDHNLYSPPFSPVYNEGVSGETMAYLANVWPSQCGIYSPFVTGTASVALQEGGHNDINNAGLDGDQTYANWLTMIHLWQNNGFAPVFACTQTPSAYITGEHEVYRQTYNTFMRAYCLNPANGVILIDLEHEYPVNSGTALYPNPGAPYQSDGLHYTQVLESQWGQQIMDLATLNSGLMAMYHMDETSGTFHDSSLNGYDLLGFQTGNATGQVNGAAALNGSVGSYLANPNLALSGTAFSFAMWVNPSSSSSSNGQVLAGNGGSSQAGVACYLQPDNTFSCVANINGSTVTARDTSNPLPANTWSFCTAVYDGSQLTVETGSNTPVSVAASGTVAGNAGDFMVGNWNSLDRPYNGKIDELGVWSRAITSGTASVVSSGSTLVSNERAQLWNLGYGRPYVPFVNASNLSNMTNINFPLGFSNAGLVMTTNGRSLRSPGINDGMLVLTDGGTNETYSAYFNQQVNVASFQTQFDFQATNAVDEGFTFCIQRSSANAIGNPGSNLGYGGMANSVAIKFDIAPSLSTTGLYVNGASPNDSTPQAIDTTSAGVNFHSGDIMRVNLSYDGATLNESITDLSTNAVFTHSYSVNIPVTIGSGSAWAGFTAASSSGGAVQDIRDWTFGPAIQSPSSLQTTLVSNSAIDFSWSNSGSDEGVAVSLASGTNAPQNLGVISGSASTYNTANLSAGTDYILTLQAYGYNGTASQVSLTVTTLCNAPANPGATGGTGNVALSWQKPTGAVSYNIYRSTSPGGEGSTPYATGVTGLNYTDSSVTIGTPYYYKISAVNDQGAAGPMSTEVSAAATPAVPALKPGGIFALGLLLFGGAVFLAPRQQIRKNPRIG
ncbi:MAG TPA: LamG-like jellyroll fold domain-containing protein [Chthoniobacteraceae bacterium]|nr:LamG-like jellyroll fold domain-containing protein [Chthoniobacteraceae bacterium]